MSRDGGAINPAGSTPGSGPGSPRNRYKFLCSHGGKILPRPPDGQLKYVGGETRVISFSRDTSFQELMKKLTYQIDGEMILKYQVESEDLDALVSVKCDEDVSHMCAEIDRHKQAGSSRLRAFLFPANPVVTEKQIFEPHALDQRYIDAINGIIRKPHPVFVHQHGSRVSSGCSSPRSPRSPDSCSVETPFNYNELSINSQSSVYHNSCRMSGMHRVRSSPSISSMNSNVNVTPQQTKYIHHYQAAKPPIDLQRGERRLISVRSVGRAEGVKYQFDPHPFPPSHYHSASKQSPVNGCVKASHFDDSPHFLERRIVGGRAMSPVPPTTRLAHADI